MGDLSKHFDRSEFRCKGFLLAGHQQHATKVSPRLVAALERLRELEGGRPLVIVSGHRCAWYNTRVGGAPRSKHVQGIAVDLKVGYASVVEAASVGFRGIGSVGVWATHVDMRTTPARWQY